MEYLNRMAVGIEEPWIDGIVGIKNEKILLLLHNPSFHYSNNVIFQMIYSIIPILQKIRPRDNDVLIS